MSAIIAVDPNEIALYVCLTLGWAGYRRERMTLHEVADYVCGFYKDERGAGREELDKVRQTAMRIQQKLAVGEEISDGLPSIQEMRSFVVIGLQREMSEGAAA